MQSQIAYQKSQITRVAVIGAGTMGHGIAQVAAMAGYETRLTDANADALATACDRIQSNLAGAVARGKMTQAQMEAATATLVPVTDLQTAIDDADLVIEAVVEDLAVKQALFQQLDGVAPDGTILVSKGSTAQAVANGHVGRAHHAAR